MTARLAHGRDAGEAALELADEVVNTVWRRKPTRMTMHITELCDARCVMCNLWQSKKTDELGPEDYDRLFTDPFFSRVRRAVITGGEATIRKDLAQLVAILETRLPRLRRITIATNALNTARLAQRLDEIVGAKVRADVEILFQVSLDGLGGVHEAVRGTPRAFERVEASVEAIKRVREEHGYFDVAFGCVMQETNIDGVYDLYAYFRQHDYEFVYTMVTESDGYYKTGEIDIRRNEASLQRRLHAFYTFLLERETNPGKRLLFSDMQRLLEGKLQKRGCPMLRDSVSIDPKGNFLPCVQAYERKYGNVAEAAPSAVWTGPAAKTIIADLKKNQCPTCTAACGVSYLAIARSEAASLIRRRRNPAATPPPGERRVAARRTPRPKRAETARVEDVTDDELRPAA
jgi:MoaA/NifB/PqqE/SkfB family radical SAM enzyme